MAIRDTRNIVIIPDRDKIYDAFKKNFPNVNIGYTSIKEKLFSTHEYTFTINKKEYEVYFSELQTPSGIDRETYLVNMFCQDLIKKSAPDILPNLLKDCKTINDIKQKLPNVGYEYNKTRTNQLTLKLGDVKFSVPFQKDLPNKDITAINSINGLSTMKGTPQEKMVLPPIGFKVDSPKPLKNMSFESTKLFDTNSFQNIAIQSDRVICY